MDVDDKLATLEMAVVVHDWQALIISVIPCSRPAAESHQFLMHTPPQPKKRLSAHRSAFQVVSGREDSQEQHDHGGHGW